MPDKKRMYKNGFLDNNRSESLSTPCKNRGESHKQNV